VEFELAIPTLEQPQTYAFYRVVTGTGLRFTIISKTVPFPTVDLSTVWLVFIVS
jgi:hypothetical protein